MGQLQCLNIQFVKERGEREREEQKIFEEIMGENFLNFVKTVKPQIQEAQQTSSQRNTKKTTPWHIKIKFLKTSGKEKI